MIVTEVLTVYVVLPSALLPLTFLTAYSARPKVLYHSYVGNTLSGCVQCKGVEVCVCTTYE